MVEELEIFPSMVRNWTADRLVIAPRGVEVTAELEVTLRGSDVPLFRGDIVALTHEQGELAAVTLDTGQAIDVGTLLWTPANQPTALVTDLVERLGLALDAHGHVAVDGRQRTNIDRLWAAGDIQGWTGAIEAATLGSMVGAMIVHDWYASEIVAAA
jgi:pyruvate/2-oxoglutarate dehydrogenase complex dihydrolipoamide dehydrogenase (E3) component